MKKLVVLLSVTALLLCSCSPQENTNILDETQEQDVPIRITASPEIAAQAPETSNLSDIVFGYGTLKGIPNLLWIWPIQSDNQIQRYYNQYASYYESEYICMLKKKMYTTQFDAKLLKDAYDLATNGLIYYTQMFIDRKLPLALGQYVPELLYVDQRFLPEGELAGLRPRDTLPDAMKKFNLFPVTVALLESESIEFIDANDLSLPTYDFYTNGDGLVICVDTVDLSISTVWVYKKGYSPIPEREIGENFDNSMRLLYCRDAQIEFGDWHKDGESGTISIISMKIYKEEIWSEVAFDVNDDGKPERIVLSGKSNRGYYIEADTLSCKTESALKYRTKTYLNVFNQDGGLLAREILPLFLTSNIPDFIEKLPPNEPSLKFPTDGLLIRVPTGGVGTIFSYYELKFNTGMELQLNYLGYI